MNRINKLFQEKRDNILSIYFTAGYPSLNDTEDIIKTLDDCGVDLIEIGMPFSEISELVFLLGSIPITRIPSPINSDRRVPSLAPISSTRLLGSSEYFKTIWRARFLKWLTTG